MKEHRIVLHLEGGTALRAALLEALEERRKAEEEAKARRRRRAFTATLAAVKYGFLAVAGLAPYFAAKEYALAWRGYEAVGGEIFLLILPLALPWTWYRLEKMIRNAVPRIISFWKQATAEKD